MNLTGFKNYAGNWINSNLPTLRIKKTGLQIMTTKSIYKSNNGQTEIMDLYDKILAQWPAPCEYLTIPTRHGDTFIIAGGHVDAPPLVLLHGTASNSAAWGGDFGEYSRYFRVYAVDIPGEPGKSDSTRFSWNGPAFVEWLEDVLNGLGIEKIRLGGMSLGAWAVINYAQAKPERVERAMLICPSGVYPPRWTFMAQVILLSLLGEWGRNRIKKLVIEEDSMSAELDQFLTLIGRHFNYRMGSPPLFSDEALQRLSMPVLFIAGEKDALLNTPQTAARLQKLLPRLTANIIKADGHATINHASQAVSFLR
jgi:pimeloyl-ACP methyl ester carboxylesterase